MKKNYFTMLFFVAAAFIANAQVIETEDFTDVTYTDGPLAPHPKWTVGLDNQFSIDDANNRILGTVAFARAIYNPVYKVAVGEVLSVSALVEFGSAAAGFNTNAGDFVGVIGFKHEGAGFNNNSEAVRVLSNNDATTMNLYLNRLSGTGQTFFDGMTAPAMSLASKGVYKITIELFIGTSAAASTFSAQLENVATGVKTDIATATGIYAPLYTAIVSANGAEGAHFYVHAQSMGNLSPFTTNSFVVSKGTTLSTSNKKSVVFGVFPNPANDILTISTLSKIASVEVSNITGQTMFTKTGVKSIDISSLSSGMYFLTVKSEEGAFTTKKFIKN